MTPDMLYAQGFAVSFPGQISREEVIKAFASSPPRADVDISNYKVLAKPARRRDFTHISRFSDPQRRLIYVANMCLLGLMRGEVYLPEEQEVVTSQVPFRQKIACLMDNPIPESLTDAMVSASKSTLTDFDSHYPSLTPAMQQQLEVIGASGMARAIILSAQEVKRLHKTRFQTVYHAAAGINGISFTDCLGPAIGRQMMSDALGAIADLRTLGIEPNLTVEDLPGAQAYMANQILGVFREINLKNILAKIMLNKERSQ